MRACRYVLSIVAIVGLAVLVTAELTALVSPAIEFPQPARIWAIALFLIKLGTIGFLWAAERVSRLEGLITTVALASSVRPGYGDTTNRSNGSRDADVTNLFSRE
jgi:hypothetical protein